MAEANAGSAYIGILPDMEGFAPALDEGVSAAVEQASQAASVLADAFQSSFAELGESLGSVLADGLAGADTAGLAEQIQSQFADLGSGLAEILATGVQGTDTTGLADAIEAQLSELGPKIGEILAEGIDSAQTVDAGSALTTAIEGEFNAVANSITDSLTGALADTDIADITSGLAEEINDQFEDAANLLVETLSRGIEDAAAESGGIEIPINVDDAAVREKMAEVQAEVAQGTAAAAGDAITAGTEGILARLKSSFGSIGDILGLIFVGAFVRKAATAFDQVLKYTQLLNFGLEQIGQQASLGELTKWAEDVSLQTGIAAEQILKMQSQLTNLGSAFFASVGPDAAHYIEVLTEDLINLGAALSKPAAGLMRTLGPSILNTPEKAVTILQKWGALTVEQAGKVKELAASGDKLAATQEILVDLQQKYAGAAAASATPLALIRNDFTLMAAQVGQFLNPALQIFSSVLISLPVPMQALGFALVGVAGVMERLMIATGGWGGAMAALSGAWSAVTATATAAMAAITGVTAAELDGTAAESAYATALMELEAAQVSENAVMTQQIVSTVELGAAQDATAVAADNLAVAQTQLAAANRGVLASALPLLGMLVAVAAAAFLWVKVSQDEKKAAEEIAQTYDEAAIALQQNATVSEQYRETQNALNAELSNTGIWHGMIQNLELSAEALGIGKSRVNQLAEALDELLHMQDVAFAHLRYTAEEAMGVWQEQAAVQADGTTAYFHSINTETEAQKQFIEALVRSQAATATQKTDIFQLIGAWQELHGPLDQATMDLIKANVEAGNATQVIQTFNKVLDEGGAKFETFSDSARNVGVALGMTGQDISNTTIAMFQEVATAEAKYTKNSKEYQKALQNVTDFVNQSRQQIKSYGASVAQSFQKVAPAMAKLGQRAHQTAAQILAASRQQVKASQQVARATSQVSRRAGEDWGNVSNYMKTYGIDVQAVAGMSKKQFQRLTQDANNWAKANKKSSDSATKPLLDSFNKLVQQGGRLGGVTDDLTNSLLGLDKVDPTVTITMPGAQEQLTLAQNLLSTLQQIDNLDPDHDGHPERQAGGPVYAGETYLVGERGPELFTPIVSGMVTPHDWLRSSRDGGGEHGTVYRIQITNWKTGEGYMRELSREEIAGDHEHARRRARQGAA